MKLLALGLALVSLLAPSFALGGDAAKPAGGPAAPAPLAKIAILGASVSSGFGLDPNADPFSGQESKLRLANVVSASIVGAHAAPLDFATMMFFMSPKENAVQTAKEALDAKPTMVVAIDYLFWLAYGKGEVAARTERLDAGLKALEPLTCPVLLGDVPDFNGVKVSPMMLAPQAIPARDVLDALQQHVRDWAKAHTNVVLVPVRDMLAKMNAGEPIDVRGNHYDKGARAKLMQEDGLHTTLEGTSALWVLALDAWLATKPASVDESAFVLKAADLATKAQAAAETAPAAPKKAKPVKGKGAKEKAGAGSGN